MRNRGSSCLSRSNGCSLFRHFNHRVGCSSSWRRRDCDEGGCDFLFLRFGSHEGKRCRLRLCLCDFCGFLSCNPFRFCCRRGEGESFWLNFLLRHFQQQLMNALLCIFIVFFIFFRVLRDWKLMPRADLSEFGEHVLHCHEGVKAIEQSDLVSKPHHLFEDGACMSEEERIEQPKQNCCKIICFDAM